MSTPAPNIDVAFEIHRLDAPFGAEILGLDTAKSLDEQTLHAIRGAFQEHHLLVFRDQVLQPDEQVAFTEQFGELELFPEADKTKHAPKIYHVANVSTDGDLLGANHVQCIYQKVNARWHTDSSYRPIPSLASIMYGVEVLPDESEGGETEFANMFAAYEGLSGDMKHLLEPLHMVHYYEFGRRLYRELPPVSHEEKSLVPPVCHPVVRVHPDRGYRRSLYITTNAGNEISGMDLEAGQALHRELAEHVSSLAFRVTHRWRKNDLVMWDNRCLLHRAAAYDMDRYRRVFRRTTVAGSGPVLGPFSNAVRDRAPH